jgi:hypothetical protein
MDIIACLLAPWSSGKDPGFVTLSGDLETQRSDVLKRSSNPLLLRHAQNALTRMNEGMPLCPLNVTIEVLTTGPRL